MEKEEKKTKKRVRLLTMRNVYDKKISKFRFSGMWADYVSPEPEDHGIWLVYGAEKNGKTTFALMLANYLRQMARVLYLSAEEGISASIQDTCLQVGIPQECSNMYMYEYMPIEDLWEKLRDRRSAKVVFIDNASYYKDELMSREYGLLKLVRNFPDKLFVILAHEEKGKPHNAAARQASKLAKVIFHVQGLAAIVGGRVGNNVGRKIPIVEDRARLYHGDVLNDEPFNSNNHEQEN